MNIFYCIYKSVFSAASTGIGNFWDKLLLLGGGCLRGKAQVNGFGAGSVPKLDWPALQRGSGRGCQRRILDGSLLQILQPQRVHFNHLLSRCFFSVKHIGHTRWQNMWAGKVCDTPNQLFDRKILNKLNFPKRSLESIFHRSFCSLGSFWSW